MWTHHPWGSSQAQIDVHMFGSATLSIGEVELTQSSDYPWDGEINFMIKAPENLNVCVNVRIPDWADGWKLSPPCDSSVDSGYLRLSNTYLRKNPRFTLHLP